MDVKWKSDTGYLEEEIEVTVTSQYSIWRKLKLTGNNPYGNELLAILIILMSIKIYYHLEENYSSDMLQLQITWKSYIGKSRLD